MRISSKGRYGLASMIYIADNGRNGDAITVIKIAEDLKISKIYLEQVFSLLKRAGLVISIKGAQGGYKLSKSASEISALDILSSIELSLFEKTTATVKDTAKGIESSMNNLLWDSLDKNIRDTLSNISLQNLLDEASKYSDTNKMMYYI